MKEKKNAKARDSVLYKGLKTDKRIIQLCVYIGYSSVTRMESSLIPLSQVYKQRLL